VFLKTWKSSVFRIEVTFNPRNHATFIANIEGDNSYEKQFDMVVKETYKVLMKYQCLYFVPCKLIIDQFFNHKKNPRPAIAARIGRTVGICYYQYHKTHTFHAFVKQAVPWDFNFERVCEVYLPRGKVNLIYDSQNVMSRFVSDDTDLVILQADIEEYVASLNRKSPMLLPYGK